MALRDILAKFGVSVDSSKLIGFDKQVQGSLGQLKKLGALIGGSFLVGKFKEFTSEIIDTGDEIGKTAKQIGISTDSLQSWRHAIGLAGGNAKVFETAAKSLNKNAFEAGIRKSKTYVDAFKRLDVEITDSQGNLKQFDDLFLDVGVSLGKLTNQTEKSALATQLFGRSGQKLLPFFDQGSDGIKKARAELQKFGGGLSADAVQKAEEAQDSLARFDLGLLSLKGRLATTVLPIITATAEKLAEFFAAVSDTTEGTSTLEAALLSAAIAAGIFGKGMFLALIKALPLIGLTVVAFLLLEDTIGTLQGKDSVIKDLFDAFAGAGSTERQVGRLNKALDDLLSKDFEGAGGEISDFFASLGEDIYQSVIEPIWRLRADMLLAVVQAIRDTATATGEAFQNYFKNLEKRLNEMSLTDAAIELAGTFIEGFIDGLAGERVAEAVKGLMKGALDAAANAIKSKSPAKEPMKIGRFFTQGYALGIGQEQNTANRAVARMVSRTTNVLGASVSQTNTIYQTISGASNPREVADRSGRAIATHTKSSYDAALESLVAVG